MKTRILLVTVIFITYLFTGVQNVSLAGQSTLEKSRVYVVFKNGAKADVQKALHAINAEFHYTFDALNAFVVSVPANALPGLSRNPNVDYIEDDVKRYPLAETTPWGMPAVQANSVSDDNAGNRTVCIIDSGYSMGHEDLPGLSNVTASDIDAGSGKPYNDSCGHGTHVAGTIAALGNNGLGVLGVLPGNNVNMHIVKVFGNDGTQGSGSCSWTYSSSLAAALDECTGVGANVVSMSLGGGLKSRTEERAFRDAYNGKNIISVAAAGNDGNTRNSYPASYDSVISVAALDSSKVVADFSQKNSQVELAAPGVAVRSTVPMYTGSNESLTVDGTSYEVTAMDGSPDLAATGPLYRCNAVDGLGSPGDCAGAAGKVCLIQRGSITFAEKAAECVAAGGIGAIIYNNADALFSGTLGADGLIPAVGLSGTDGATLNGKVGTTATVETDSSGNYAYFDGTSMATPHVSGVAALVWSQNTACTNQQIRDALDASAEDLGAPGRDTAYGFGLVQAQAAITALGDCGIGGGTVSGDSCPVGSPNPNGAAIGSSCTSNSDCCSDTCKGKPGNQVCK